MTSQVNQKRQWRSWTFDLRRTMGRGGISTTQETNVKAWSTRSARSSSLVPVAWEEIPCFVSVEGNPFFFALSCTTNSERGAWFLHNLSGYASQLSLPCVIRLECRHDVFHSLGDARGEWYVERANFLTNIAKGCKDPNVVMISSPKSVRVFAKKYVTWTTKPTGCIRRTT